MVEADLNRLLVKSIKQSGGWATKLVDPSYADLMRGAQRVPYDYYGTLENGQSIDSESKLIKPNTTTQLLSSFSFKKIEDHQFDNLNKQVEIRERNNTDAIIVYSIGYWVSRKLNIVFFFDAKFIQDLMDAGKTSFTGKEMKEFYDKDLYLTVKNKYIPMTALPDVIIRETL